MTRSLDSLALIAVTILAIATGASADVLTVETAVDIRSLGDLDVAPDGTRAAYVLRVPRDADDDPGSSYSEIWVATLDGGPPRRYTAPRVNSSSPRWSPDGTRIAFLSRRAEQDEDASQIYVIRIDGGEAEALTESATAIGDLRWSPDGRRIAFAAGDDEPDKKEAEDAGRDWIVVDEHDAYRRLWVIEVETRETNAIYDDDLHVATFEWTPDGKHLVFVAAPTPDTDDGMMRSRIHRVSVSAPDTPDAAGPQALVRTEGKLGDLAVSPGGATLAFLGATSMNDPLPQSIFVTPIDGSEPRNLSRGFEGSVESVQWLDDERLLEAAAVGTRTTLSIVDAVQGSRRVVAGGQGRPGGTLIFRSARAHPSSGRLWVIAHRTDRPTELYVFSPDTGTFERLTSHNAEVEALTLARAETISWTTADGRRIEGVVTHPVNRDPARPAPLVVNPHGGPEGATPEGWSDLAQLLAARGYVVLQPNYRGSAGRGVAFTKADHDDLGGAEFRDILAGIDELVARGIADPDRVGMGGWSYGGYMSAMAATHHSERFKAAVMGAGISNWISFTGTTDIPDEMSIVHWNRPMQANVDLYWERSPLSAIDKAQTPTLILFGAGDERVHPGQGHELHQALQDRGVPTRMVLYPRAGHGIRERAHRIDLLTRQLDWFDTYLK